MSVGVGHQACASSHLHRHGEQGHRGPGPGQSLEGRCPGTAVKPQELGVSWGLQDGRRCRGSPRGGLRARLPCPGPQPPPPHRAVPQRAVQACLWATRRLPRAGSWLCPEALHLPGLGSALKAPVLLLSPAGESIWAQGDPELLCASRLTGPSEQTLEVGTTVPPLVS